MELKKTRSRQSILAILVPLVLYLALYLFVRLRQDSFRMIPFSPYDLLERGVDVLKLATVALAFVFVRKGKRAPAAVCAGLLLIYNGYSIATSMYDFFQNGWPLRLMLPYLTYAFELLLNVLLLVFSLSNSRFLGRFCLLLGLILTLLRTPIICVSQSIAFNSALTYDSILSTFTGTVFCMIYVFGFLQARAGQQSKGIAALLSLLSGLFGTHRFYYGRNLTGVLQALGIVCAALGGRFAWKFLSHVPYTRMELYVGGGFLILAGLFLLWTLVDFICILAGALKPAAPKALTADGPQSAYVPQEAETEEEEIPSSQTGLLNRTPAERAETIPPTQTGLLNRTPAERAEEIPSSQTGLARNAQNAPLTDADVSRKLEDLAAQYRDGKITRDEFLQGREAVFQAQKR